MLAKKTSLRIFIISVIIVSLLTNTATAQNTTQDNHEKYQVTFDFEIVDAFTGEPLDGEIHVHAWVADELWKESIAMGEFKEDILVKKFKGGRAYFTVPLHGQYEFGIIIHSAETPSPFGYLPHYDSHYGWMIFEGKSEVHAQIKVFPVGYVFVKLYSPEGKLMKFGNWDELYRYNLASFFGTYDDLNFTESYLSEEGDLAVKIPAGKPSRIYWMDYVPNYGFAWLIADNDGRGYLLNKGEYTVINLVYDSAKTMLRKAITFIEGLPSDVPLSENVTQYLHEAQELIKTTESLDERNKALNSWKALEKTLKAWEQAILDYSNYRIQKHRMGELALDLPPRTKANITLDYIDLMFSPGWDLDMSNPFIRGLQRLSRFATIEPYPYMNKDGSIPEEKFRKHYEDFKRGLMAKRFNAPGGDLAYNWIYSWNVLEQPEDIRELIAPFNLTAVMGVTKKHLTDLINLSKKYGVNLKTIEMMIEYDKVAEYAFRFYKWDKYYYARPLTLKEKAEVARELSQLIHKLDPKIRTVAYLCGVVNVNPRTFREIGSMINHERYATLDTISGLQYFLEKGVEVDIASVQIHALAELGLLNTIDLFNSLQRLDDLASKYGISIGVEELTIPSEITDAEPLYVSDLKKAVDEEFQARLMRNYMIVMLGFPNLVRILYTTNVDASGPEFYGEAYEQLVNQTAGKIRMGYFREDLTPKPAYFALRNLFDSLIFEGECPGTPVKTLAGWYNITLYREDGRPIETYRIHVDGGSTTRLIVRFFENETLKVEVERLRSELEAHKSEIEELQKKVNSLQQQLAEKDETIHRLKEELSKHPETITVTITKTLKTTETVVSPSKDASTLLLIALVAGLAVVTITVAIIALGRRANYVRR